MCRASSLLHSPASSSAFPLLLVLAGSSTPGSRGTTAAAAPCPQPTGRRLLSRSTTAGALQFAMLKVIQHWEAFPGQKGREGGAFSILKIQVLSSGGTTTMFPAVEEMGKGQRPPLPGIPDARKLGIKKSNCTMKSSQTLFTHENGPKSKTHICNHY